MTDCDSCHKTFTALDQVVRYTDTSGNPVVTHVDCVQIVVGDSSLPHAQKADSQKKSFLEVIASNADTIKAELLECEQRLQVLSKESDELKTRANMLRALLPENNERMRVLGYRA